MIENLSEKLLGAKAQAYDTLRNIESLSERLKSINQVIGQLERAMMESQTSPSVSPEPPKNSGEE